MKKLIIIFCVALSIGVKAQQIPVPQKHIVAMANKCDSVITYLRSTGMPDAQLLYIQLLLKEATTPLINDVWIEKRRVDSLKVKKR